MVIKENIAFVLEDVKKIMNIEKENNGNREEHKTVLL